jgi:hypothetical protein
MTVHIRKIGFGLILGALVLAPIASALAEESFFDEGRAQGAVEKIFDKAGHPTTVLSLAIRPQELVVELQDPAQPKHVDAWTEQIDLNRFRSFVFGSESTSGPRPVDLNLPNPDVDANLFELKPADLAIVPKLIAAAVKRAALEDAAGIDRMELRRQLHLVPRPSSGPPEWSIEVTSGRERAEIYADLPGHITHANLDGTRRAQALNYLKGGKELDAVVASIAEVLGKGEIIKSLIVYDHYLAFNALDPDHPDRYVSFTAGLNGIYHDVMLDPIAAVTPPGQIPAGRFAITDVDWSLLTKLEDAARDRLQFPGGTIGIVDISKPGNGAGGPALEWEVNIADAKDQATSGAVVFDNTGKILRTRYPRGKGPKLDLLDAANIAPAFDALKTTLGEHAAVSDLAFRNDSLLIETKDPKNPDERLVFEYRGETLARSIMPPFSWPTFGPDWFFDLAQAQPVVAQWSGLEQDTLTRLGLPDGKIERVTISKQRLEMPRNDRVLVEVRAEAGKRAGRVVYDLTGKPVEIVKP